jgi:Amt family ammonium transporter
MYLLCLTQTALVFIMTPAVGLVYSGMSRQKNSLTMLMLSMLCYAVVTVQWILFGFSLAFSETGSPWIGNFAWVGLENIKGFDLPTTAPGISTLVYSIYQLQFATVTCAIIFGSVAERVRIVPSMVFMFLWTTFVYDFVANWTWSAHGWLRNLGCYGGVCGRGALDFAGGNAVHIASGFSGLVFSVVLGKRKFVGKDKPHNLVNVFFGTALLWFGWIGFNGGSALAPNNRAAMAATTTIISSAMGGLAWMLVDWITSRTISAMGFCMGVLAGLVCITPGAGFVAPWHALIFGFFGGAIANYGCKVKTQAQTDDSFDVFGIHGAAGIVGTILTGVFASKRIAALDGAVIDGGLIEGQGIQVLYQIAACFATATYASVATFIILQVIDRIPGLQLRPGTKEEVIGGDREINRI